MKLRAAIVGGGPGGLMTAHHLENKFGDDWEFTIFEAGSRVGGKIVTRRFATAPAIYEAGVAELYDYSMIGEDPLKELIAGLGLSTVPMEGETVVIGDRILRSPSDIERLCGRKTAAAIEAFREKCAEWMSPAEYYENAEVDALDVSLGKITAQELLEREIDDWTARTYIRVAARSDLATELHLTNGSTGLKNFLMDVPGYIGLYSVEGGIERFPEALSARLTRTQIRTNRRVERIGRVGEREYRITYCVPGVGGTPPERRFEHYDLVVIALPHNWLSTLAWDDERLEGAMRRHIAFYDRPAHYLRVTLLFEEPFWRPTIPGSWWMSDAFGGCCVYDEGSRHDAGECGVLNWLIAGTDALAMANLDDRQLLELAMDSLPGELHFGRDLFIEGCVHRWLASVNALPGGFPVPDLHVSHAPARDSHPGIFVVGDYIFDSTLNGALDSADCATELMLGQALRIRFGEPDVVKNLDVTGNRAGGGPFFHFGQIDRTYFENYRGRGNYDHAFGEFFDHRLVADWVRLAWGDVPPYRLLDAGSATGVTLRGFHSLGIDARGIENNRYIHARTAPDLISNNHFGSLLNLPFPDDSFDFVYETCLCHISENRVDQAISELFRVARKGIIFGSVTSDMSTDVIHRFDLLKGVKTLGTWWEWSERFLDRGFEFADLDPVRLDRLWERTLAAGKGPDDWFPDAETLRYCFFSRERSTHADQA